MNSGLKVHAIEQDAKQAQAMMANLRNYAAVSQLGKIVPNSKFRVSKEATEEEAKEAPPVEVKCGQCSMDTLCPPAEKCHSCGAYCCVDCIPRLDVPGCPVCEDVFRSVDVVLPAQPAV